MLYIQLPSGQDLTRGLVSWYINVMVSYGLSLGSRELYFLKLPAPNSKAPSTYLILDISYLIPTSALPNQVFPRKFFIEKWEN